MKKFVLFFGFLFLIATVSPTVHASENTEIQSEFKKAEFPGGKEELKKWLRENINYPEGAKRYGSILVTFTVKKNGKLDDFKVKKGVSEFLDYAAVEILKGMPKWIPAEKNGKTMDSENQVSVKFTPKEEE